MGGCFDTNSLLIHYSVQRHTRRVYQRQNNSKPITITGILGVIGRLPAINNCSVISIRNRMKTFGIIIEYIISIFLRWPRDDAAFRFFEKTPLCSRFRCRCFEIVWKNFCESKKKKKSSNKKVFRQAEQIRASFEKKTTRRTS